MIRRISALLIGLAVCINLAWIQPAAGAVDYSLIRVMLSSMGTPDRITLRVEGEYSISHKLGDKLIDKGKYEIYVEGGQLILKNDSTTRAMGSTFTFKSERNSFSNYLRILNNSYGWTNYLGDMEVRLVDGGIRLINHIFLEYYLYGVVPYEMSNSWPIEALKAQAIAARTYAVRCRTSFSYFDLYDTEVSQVYRGYNPSWQNAIKAVDETYGMVLKYGNNFASTYYSSSNGGRTESCGNLWGEHVPYLIVQADPFDVTNPNNPNATWTVEYSKLSVDPAFQARIKARMQADLEASGYSGNEGDIQILQIKELSFDPPNDSGRMEKGQLVVVADVKSKRDDSIHTLEYTINLTKSNIRSLLNLKSLLFVVEETEDSYILHGGGYGHGVGMSQFGAQQMALEGLTFAHILGFYYQGTRIETLPIVPPESRGGERPDEPEAPEPEDPKAEEPEPKDPKPENPKPEDPKPEDPEPEKPQNPNQPEAIYGIVKVTTSLNVRQGPGIHYARIGGLSPNTRVQVLEQGAEWHKIRVGNLEGYVSNEYIKIENEEQTKPQEPGPGQNPVKPEVPAPPPDKRYGIVVASALNIRSGPSTRNHKVGMVIKGTRLTIIGQSDVWYKIEVNGLEGYVHGDYLKISSGSGSPNTTPAKTGTVSASALNVRTGPGTDYPRITLLYRGEKVAIIKETSGWYQIQYGNSTGYVSSEYINF